MLRIVALNESESEEEHNDETTVTKEAQETIAESEYVRALKLKSQGKTEAALSLLTELLETNVLNEIFLENKDDKLLAIRYNCHKNIALMHEERAELQLALEHFICAMQIDDNDVYAMHRLGQLALKLNALGMADYAFEKCLKRNPNHWPAADGILQILCLNQNVMGAYGWALKWYQKDNKYERALDVLVEITENFPDLIPFYETIWKTPFRKPAEYNTKRIKNSVFPEPKDTVIENCEMVKPTDLDQFRVKKLNWSSLGRYIISVYKHLEKTKQCIIFILTVDDFLEQEDTEKVKSSISASDENLISSRENSNGPPSNISNEYQEDLGMVDVEVNQLGAPQLGSEFNHPVFVAPSTDNIGSKTPQQIDSNAEDSDTNVKLDAESNKPKPRRRCSDLSFLEQWGWHKNRRHSSRKKSQQDRPEVDPTLNGFLRRIFAKYTENNFNDDWPFKSDNVINYAQNTVNGDDPMAKIYSEETLKKFTSESQNDFDSLLVELKSKPFDLIVLVFKWLKYVSKYWAYSIGDELKYIYYEIFTFYMNHYDLATWNQMSNNNFNASYLMCLFFLEIDYDRTVESKGQISSVWQMLFNHLMFNSGCAFVISDEYYERNQIRLIHMEYCWAKYNNQLSKCVKCLEHLEYLIGQQSFEFHLSLPNFKASNNCISKESTGIKRIETQRQIALNKVSHLFETNHWSELVEILTENLIHSKEIPCENWVRDLQIQFEVLLQSIWNINQYEKCLIWSERCLHYSVNKYICDASETYRQKRWAECINYIFSYIESLVLSEGYGILDSLGEFLPRMVQNVIRLLTCQLDASFDKNNNPIHALEIKRPWIVLHHVLLRDENHNPVVIKTKPVEITMETEEIEDLLPHSFLMLFTAHEFLGKRQWCTRDNGALLQYSLDVIAPNLRVPLYDSCRDIVHEYIEQTTYCLFGFPPKKARSRHIEEHEATSVELTWPKAIQIFDLYRPENLPEFNSYKVESITADMEQLLLKIVSLIPKDIDPNVAICNIQEYIAGNVNSLPDENDCNLLPYKISSIYYLLADYYFKNRDFSKTLKYYSLDLTCHPTRFDSWAGLALSKASRIETKLNGFVQIELNNFLMKCEHTLRCFEQCIKLNRQQTLLWIEYGSFAYTIHSFCSRDLKHSSDTLSLEQFTFVEERKEKFLSISYDCFSLSAALQNTPENNDEEEPESHEEKWLNQYMLGKIAEKRKDEPTIYMNHYLTAANYLYENNATYPIKINHSNPTTLSVEALEIFYRTNSAIIKFLEQGKEITRDVGILFNRVLKNLGNSPFAFNKAKIDGNSLNAFKRKIADKVENSTQHKLQKLEMITSTSSNAIEEGQAEKSKNPETKESQPTEAVEGFQNVETDSAVEKEKSVVPETQSECILAPESKTTSTSPSRRGSQESSATTTTTTTATATTSSVSSTSGSDSSSSDSDNSDSYTSTSEDDGKKPDKNTPFSEHELEHIYKTCVRNLEECVTRFPEHYKSVYRLVYHYMNAPEKYQDLERCRQLLLGQYITSLGNQINGLFSDRKNNNIFNGIWRIPSSEIDRPGSFSSHLVKCVSILIQVLRKLNNHKLLIDVSLQLYRTPDNDKRYIKDCERMELCQQSITYCLQIMRNILKRNMEVRDNVETLNLLIDIYKTYKKCNKHMVHKEMLFAQLLVEAYKFYIEDKVLRIPENVNLLDLAIKLCLQELSSKKNQEKLGMPSSAHASWNLSDSILGINSPQIPHAGLTSMANKPIQIPGMTSRPRGRPVGSRNALPHLINSNTATASAPATTTTSTTSSSISVSQSKNTLDQTNFASLMALYGTPAMITQMQKDPIGFPKLVAEYFNLLGGPTSSGTTLYQNLTVPSINPFMIPQMDTSAARASLPAETTITATTQPKVPQFDIKNLIASAASQVSKSAASSSQTQSTIINIGGGELTITPTSSKSSLKDNRPNSPRPSTAGSMGKNHGNTTSISLTKIPNQSPSIYVKPLADLQTTKPTISPKLPDLPKSLSITPSNSCSVAVEKSRTLQLSKLSDTSISAGEKFQGKVKSTSKKKLISNQAPYARTSAAISPQPPALATFSSRPALNSADLATFANLSQQFPIMNNFNMENYNQQAAILSTYADILKSVGGGVNPAMLGQLSQVSQQFQMLGHKRPNTKRSRAPKLKAKLTTAATSTFPTQASTTNANIDLKSVTPTDKPTSSINMSSFNSSGITISAAYPGVALTKRSGSPANSKLVSKTISTPPPQLQQHSGLQASPTKTLQQKLAERQKANQLNENANIAAGNGNKGPSTIDVIILD